MSALTPEMVRRAVAEFAFETECGAPRVAAMTTALEKSGIADLVDRVEHVQGQLAERDLLVRRRIADVTGSPV